MALLKIARMGHPVLLQVAEEVADPGAPEIRRLVSDMIETMIDAPGIGLAAPQVHVPLRLFVFHLPADRSGGEAVPPGVVINPVWEAVGEERVLRVEGCLSIPGLRAAVPRGAVDPLSWRGLRRARAWRPGSMGCMRRWCSTEYDHLDGVLYPMRVTDFSQFGFVEELARFPPAAPLPGGGADGVSAMASGREARDAAIEALLPLVPRLGWDGGSAAERCGGERGSAVPRWSRGDGRCLYTTWPTGGWWRRRTVLGRSCASRAGCGR